jgi:flagellar basal body rod protein FlgG
MGSDVNLKALNNIGIMQQVSANNVANALTTGFKASRTTQTGDRVTISQEARNAGIDMNGQPLSNTDLGEEMVQMTKNEVMFKANINAIQTQNEMDAALLSIKK